MQRLSNEIIRDLKAFSAAYLNDTVVFSRSWEGHTNASESVVPGQTDVVTPCVSTQNMTI